MARRQINNNNRYNNNNNNHNPNGYGVGHHHHHHRQQQQQPQQQHPDSVMNQLSWFTGAPYTKFMLLVSVASYCISRSTTISSSMLLFDSSFHHMTNSRNRDGDHPYMLYYSYGFYNRIAGGFNSSSSSSSSSSLFFTRYILSKLFYSGKITSNSEFLIGICLLTYMMRKYEREMGSRRFILFYIFINVITIVMEFIIVTISSSASSASSSIWLLGSSIIPTYTYRGPYPLLGALFIGLFHRYTPRLYPQFLGLFGIHCSEKIFYYLGFLQLICITSNNNSNTNTNNSHFLLRYLYNDKMIPVLCGAMACSAYLAIPTTTKRTLDDILLPDYIVNIISPWSTRLFEVTSPVYVTHGGTTTTTLNNTTTTTSANSRGGGAAGAFRQYRGGGGIAPTSGATSRAAAAAASRQGPPGRLGGGGGGLGDMASALQQQEQLLQQLLSQTPYHAPSNMMAAPGGATTAGSSQQQQQQQQQQAPALRPSAPTPVVEPDPAAMEQLTMMGFEQTQVIAALRRTNNNVERAADQLLQQAGMG